MNATEAQVFEVVLAEPEPTKFELERRAFFRLLPELLVTHRGQYVAIHNERVVDSGPVRIDVVFRSQAKVCCGVYVGLVSTEPPRILRSGIRRVLRAEESES